MLTCDHREDEGGEEEAEHAHLLPNPLLHLVQVAEQTGCCYNAIFNPDMESHMENRTYTIVR